MICSTARILVLLGLIFPSALNALSCAKPEHILEGADHVFLATPTKIEIQPEGVKPPEVAVHVFEVPRDAFDQIPSGVEFEIEECDPRCRSWKGTHQDLPAMVVDQWFEVELRVHRVWRGTLLARETIYSIPQLELGEAQYFLLQETESGALEIGGACSRAAVVPAYRKSKLPELLGEPTAVYSETGRANQ